MMSSKTKTTATKEEARPALVPKLRFPEFQDADGCRIRKLNELLYEAKHRNRTLALGPSDVLSVSGDHGCVNQIEFMGRSYAGVTVKDYHVVEQGDIVYTKSPLKRNPYGIIKENKGKRGIVSTLYAVYRPYPCCSATYLDHFFSVDYNLNAYLQPIVKKGAKNDMKVNNADVLKGDICAPELPEQQKIADCLNSVDELIAAQALKLDALKTHKKGLMQQLFPSEGKTQPRLRFPEFQNAGEWVETTLGAACRMQAGKFVSASDIREKNAEGLFPCYGGNGLRGYTTTFTHSGKYPLIGRQGALCGNVKLGLGQFHATEHAVVVTPKNNVAVDWLFYLLDFLNLNQYATGQAQPGLSVDVLDKVPVSISNQAPEQQRIADCLTRLDDLIAAQTQTLEALKTHKQGLMQQLFPSPEAASV